MLIESIIIIIITIMEDYSISFFSDFTSVKIESVGFSKTLDVLKDGVTRLIFLLCDLILMIDKILSTLGTIGLLKPRIFLFCFLTAKLC
jgi:hypothetical protein